MANAITLLQLERKSVEYMTNAERMALIDAYDTILETRCLSKVQGERLALAYRYNREE